MKIIEIVTPIENFSAVESIITRHDSEILWVNVDEDKKKKGSVHWLAMTSDNLC